MKPLNDKQRKLVEDNHKLIYSFMNSHRLSHDSDIDWYGVSAVGLCKAAATYNPDKGSSFATYAYSCMNNEVRQTLRTNETKLPKVNINFKDIEDQDMDVFDVIPDMTHNMEERLEIFDAVDRAVIKHSHRDKSQLSKIVNLRIEGYNGREIGKMLGICSTYVTRLLASVSELIKQELAEEE